MCLNSNRYTLQGPSQVKKKDRKDKNGKKEGGGGSDEGDNGEGDDDWGEDEVDWGEDTSEDAVRYVNRAFKVAGNWEEIFQILEEINIYYFWG